MWVWRGGGGGGPDFRLGAPHLYRRSRCWQTNTTLKLPGVRRSVCVVIVDQRGGQGEGDNDHDHCEIYERIVNHKSLQLWLFINDDLRLLPSGDESVDTVEWNPATTHRFPDFPFLGLELPRNSLKRDYWSSVLERQNTCHSYLVWTETTVSLGVRRKHKNFTMNAKIHLHSCLNCPQGWQAERHIRSGLILKLLLMSELKGKRERQRNR